jgi:hypothetical protein
MRRPVAGFKHGSGYRWQSLCMVRVNQLNQHQSVCYTRIVSIFRCLMTLTVSKLYSVSWWDGMNDQLGWIWKETLRDQIEMSQQAFVWKDWGNPQSSWVRVAVVPAKIGTEHLSNTNTSRPACSVIRFFWRHSQRNVVLSFRFSDVVSCYVKELG